MQSVWLVIAFFLSIVPSRAYCMQVPKIEKCEYVDAYSIECWWKTFDRSSPLVLTYTKKSEKNKTIHICNHTKTRTTPDATTISYCQTQKVTYYTQHYFTLTPHCNNLERNLFCPNVTLNWFKFTPNENNVVLRSPPTDLQVQRKESSNIYKFTWKSPDLHYSMQSYVYGRRTVIFKLVYKERTTNEDTEEEANSVWKVLHIGRKKSYSSGSFHPNTNYSVRVYIAVEDNANESNSAWSLPSNVVWFKVPKQSRVYYPSATRAPTVDKGTTTEAIKAKKSPVVVPIAVIIPMIILLIIVFLIILCFVGKKYRCLPTKIKIPKPILMIPIEDLSIDQVFIDTNVSEKDAEAILLSSRLLDVEKSQNNDSSHTHQEIFRKSIELFHDNRSDVEGRFRRQPFLPQNELSRQDERIKSNKTTSAESLRQTEVYHQNGNSHVNAYQENSDGDVWRHSWNNKSYNSLLKADKDGQQLQSSSKPQKGFLDSSLYHKMIVSSYSEEKLKQGNPNFENKNLLFLRSPSTCDLDKVKRHSFENLDKRGSSPSSMDYVMENCISGTTVFDNGILSPEEENFAIKKHALHLHSKTDEEIPVYVKQCGNFGNIDDNLSMFVVLRDAVNLNSSVFSDCSSIAQEKYIRNLYPPFTIDKPKLPSVARNTDDDISHSTGSQYSRSSLSNTSIDSGYSPDTRSPL